MSRRFQFSLSRLIGSLSLFCVAVCLWRQSSNSSFGLNPFALAGFGMTVAAGVGILFHRALDWAIAAYVVIVGLALLALVSMAGIFWLVV